MLKLNGFVLGFGLSFFSVSLIGQLMTVSQPQNYRKDYISPTKIELFKPRDTGIFVSPQPFIEVKKETLLLKPLTESVVSSNKEISFNEIKNIDLGNIGPHDEQIAYSFEGIEDDEIIPISQNADIPMDFSNQSETENAVFSNNEDENRVAALPHFDNNVDTDASPWIVAKGSKHIKNKKLLEQFTDDSNEKLTLNNFKKDFDEDKELSYKIAEKIKQSIIFPIPDEIANDENLIPTFVDKSSLKEKKNPQGKDISQKSDTQNTVLSSKKDTSESTQDEAVSVSNTVSFIPKTKVSEQETNESKTILDSLSSWFSNKPSVQADNNTQKEHKKIKKAPSYSSNFSNSSPEENLVNFYEKMQETKKEYIKNSIIPTELKLYFQPDKAEISGQTLKWLKTFSDATKNSNSTLEIRLNASTAFELQKKRLNLLYTIFMNNGVDFDKINTVLTTTEPNALIIRVLINNTH